MECPEHFDFGDDGDEAGLGVGDDFVDVVLGVEAAVVFIGLLRGGLGGGGAARGGGEGFFERAEGGDGGELGVLENFDAPALVVGEVPVESVEFVEGEGVDVAEDVLFGEEVAGAVEEDAAPRVAGGVFDVEAGEGEGVFACRGF